VLQGFAELEYGILAWMGAIDSSTPGGLSQAAALTRDDCVACLLPAAHTGLHLHCLCAPTRTHARSGDHHP
jgi:hypothetical protein